MPPTPAVLLRAAAVAASLPVLAAHLCATAARAALSRRRPAPAGDALDVVFPYPPGDRSGGSKAIQGLLETLGRGYRLNRVALYDLPPAAGRVRRLLADWLTHALPAALHVRPLLLAGGAVRRRLTPGRPLVVEFLSGAFFLWWGPRPAGPVVLREHEPVARRLLGEARSARGAERLLLRLKAAAAWLVAMDLYLKADRVVALTPEDAAWVRRAFPPVAGRVLDLPVSFDLPPLPHDGAPPARRQLLFVGNFWHRPNVDALRWFLAECAPHLGPGWTLHLCGLDQELREADLPPSPVRVVRHGFVEDVGAALPGVRVAVAPVVSGAGVRMKNLFLASRALAVVTTPLGNEGIGFAPGVEAAVCADGASMARELARLDADPAAARAMGLRARERVRAGFGHDGLLARWRAEVLSAAPAAAAPSPEAAARRPVPIP